MAEPGVEEEPASKSSQRKLATFAGALGGAFGVLSVAFCVVSATILVRRRRARSESTHPEAGVSGVDNDDDIDGMATSQVPMAEVTLHTPRGLASLTSITQPPPYAVPPAVVELTRQQTEEVLEYASLAHSDPPPTFAEAIRSPIPPLLANLRTSHRQA